MKYSVTAASTWWRLNGVNLFSADLISGLARRGHDAELVLTRLGGNPQPMPAFPGLSPKPFAFPRSSCLHTRRMAFKKYLENRGPCVYLPNHDVRYSCISPLLAESVRTVGIIHSDDPFHYEHARRLGASLDAVVCVSSCIMEKTRRLLPAHTERIHFIPYGIPAGEPAQRPQPGHPLKLLYAGRLEQYQKNVFAFKDLLAALDREKVDFRLTMAGDGIDRKSLEKKLARYMVSGKVSFTGTLARKELFQLYAEHDAFILLSRFEGLPIALLEAMSRGCIPVAMRTESGIPELIRDGENGYITARGDFISMARILSHIGLHNALRSSLSRQARRTLLEGPYGLENMLNSYEALFASLWEQRAQRAGAKKILPPPLLPPGSWTRPWDMLRKAARYARPPAL